jgi:hypothetical protein
MPDGRQKHITLKVLELLETKMKSKIKSFYDGQLMPEAISKHDLPLLYIELLSSSTAAPGSGTGTVKDAEDFVFQITVVLDRKKNYNNKIGAGQNFNSIQRDLQNIVEERDENNALRDDTIKGIIRDNIQLGSNVMYTENVVAEYQDYINEDEYPLAKVSVQFDAHLRSTR